MLNNKKFDAIVIGAGLNGSWAAKELTENGLNVAVIDAGEKLTKEFFDISSQKNETDVFDARQHLFRFKFLLKGDMNTALDKFIDARTKQITVDNDQYPYEVSADKPFHWLRVRAVGGRGHLWGRVMIRFTDKEFRAAEIDGHGINWPITYEDLKPYYEEVETLLELGGQESELKDFNDGVYLQERNLNELETLLKTSIQSKWSERNFVTIPVAGYAPGPVSPMLHAAMKTGLMTLIPDSAATKIITCSNNGLAKGVSVVNTKTQEEFQLFSDILVVAASPFETVRLLLSSYSNRHPNGLGNSSSLLGTHIMEHVNCIFVAQLPSQLTKDVPQVPHNPFKLNNAPHGFYIPPFRHRETDNLEYSRCYGIQGVISPEQSGFYIGFCGETLPRIDNRVSINRNKLDKLGMPIPQIDFSWGDNDLKMWKDQRNVGKEIIETFEQAVDLPFKRRLTAQIHNFLRFNKPPTPGAARHEGGGARMGDSPHTSVVNPYGRLWDSPNVLICDASVFPSIGYQNSSLTSMALCLRACRNLVKETNINSI